MEGFANSTLATGCHTAGPIGHRRRGICPHSAVCSLRDVKSWWQVSTTLYWCPSLSLFVYLCLPGIPYILYYITLLFEFIFALADFQWLSYEGLWRTIVSHARLCIPEHYEHISESTRRSSIHSRLCHFAAPYAKHLGLLKSWILRSPTLTTFNMRLYTCEEWKAPSKSESRMSSWYQVPCAFLSNIFDPWLPCRVPIRSQMRVSQPLCKLCGSSRSCNGCIGSLVNGGR